MSFNDNTAPSLADAGAATRELFDAPDTPAGAEPAQQPAEVNVDTPTEGTTPPVETPRSWDQIDLSVLSEADRKIVEDGYLRHSDYTRKTQELAEQRKQIEQFGDIETVNEAMTFVQNLQDPEFLRQLKADIETHLGSVPGEQAQAPTTEETAPGLDPAIQRDLQELKAWKAEQDHLRQENALVDQMQAKLQTEEDSIRADYPSYTQKDIDKIYELSPAVGYDLYQAQAIHESNRQFFTEQLLGNKGNLPSAANNARSDAPVQSVHDIVDFKDAKAATAALFNAQE